MTVVIIGAGQIGSRHLQALARSSRIKRVEVVGRSARSLEIAEQRYRQVAAAGGQSVRFVSALAELSDTIDVAIVATNADTRFAVVMELVETKRVGALILEKVVFQAPREFDLAITELKARAIPAWVNCWRRALPVYADLRDALARETHVSLTVHGGEWGLGCNAVHYVDLCAFLAGNDAAGILSSQLDAAILQSKRPGFVEFTGTIRGTCAPHHHFELTARAGSDEPPSMRITARNGSIMVDEIGQTVAVRHGSAARSVQLPFQSELTHKLVEEILDRGASSLPTLEQSYQVHAPLLELFTAHLERMTGASYGRCPIT